jgi:hypothetical protein
MCSPLWIPASTGMTVEEFLTAAPPTSYGHAAVVRSAPAEVVP